ncbi:MAG: hypothetical protein DRQ46_03795 [Gammaproteobacteria bacterium]|nr:MAG: hypothetical protein DRQ46_03795 [Gammaproteobacteria bacterium]
MMAHRVNIVDPPKPSWPCHEGRPCSCDNKQELKRIGKAMEAPTEHGNLHPDEEGNVSFEDFEREAQLNGDYKKNKFVSLFKSRTVISKIGTMPERRLALKMLKIMKRDGVKSV